MKHHFKKLLILIPLVFIGGLALAAYSFTAPTSGPSANNTDSPLDTSSTDQIKNGNLAVNTFQSAAGAYFAQQVSLTGMVRGGTPSDASSTVSFGDSGHAVSVSNIGNTGIAGNYQSDSLKTSGGTKPLCADTHGTLYICNTTPPTNTAPIYLSSFSSFDPSISSDINNNNYRIYVSISEPTSSTVTATLSATSGNVPAAMNFLKGMFTAEARMANTCNYTTTPTTIGTLTINPDNTVSWDNLTLPIGCDNTNSYVYISSYSPHVTAGGRTITLR
ncbi:MAG: hypothetical protein JWM92_378 [Candidatus Nomurabacteria bacterium]|jgi:hypothetical protein|nr:hypothetical protein [Candidatus Nomurabacteria bacterium]